MVMESSNEPIKQDETSASVEQVAQVPPPEAVSQIAPIESTGEVTPLEPVAHAASVEPVTFVGPVTGGVAAKRPGGGQRFLLSALIAVFGIGTVVNGGLLVQSGDDLTATDVSLSALETENSTLQASIAQQQTAADALSAEIAAMQRTVSGLSGATPSGTPATTDFTITAKIIEPTIVYVEASDRTGGGTGSGTIIRADGYVLTNQHVIAGATSITVTLKSGEKFSATVLASNADLDAAVLKLNTTRKDLADGHHGQFDGGGHRPGDPHLRLPAG